MHLLQTSSDEQLEDSEDQEQAEVSTQGLKTARLQRNNASLKEQAVPQISIVNTTGEIVVQSEDADFKKDGIAVLSSQGSNSELTKVDLTNNR